VAIVAGEDEPEDPDRAAILARRRRFIALAISGLATSGCKRSAPEPCLSIAAPEDDGGLAEEEEGEALEPGEEGGGANGPFVEEPGAPLETGETGGSEDTGGEAELEDPQPRPEVCLKVKPKPRPCLKKRPPPQPCLMVSD
jgi:hypothetical protein